MLGKCARAAAYGAGGIVDKIPSAATKNGKPLITASDEALIIILADNCEERWHNNAQCLASHNWAAHTRIPKLTQGVDFDKDPNCHHWVAKCTTQRGGLSKSGTFLVAGLTKFAVLLKTIEATKVKAGEKWARKEKAIQKVVKKDKDVVDAPPVEEESKKRKDASGRTRTYRTKKARQVVNFDEIQVEEDAIEEIDDDEEEEEQVAPASSSADDSDNSSKASSNDQEESADESNNSPAEPADEASNPAEDEAVEEENGGESAE